MPSFSRIAWARLVFVPVWVLLLGLTPGQWHCADGRPCEAATARACCCGCTEEPGNIRHLCEAESTRALLSEGVCGCYRQALSLDIASARFGGLDAPALPLASRVIWEVSGASSVVHRIVPAAAHSPPRYLAAPSPPRAPPVA